MSTPRHGLPATTHTVEMAQITDLNGRLENSRAAVITAAEIGMAGVDVAGAGPTTLEGSAVLLRVSWEGSPEFPTVHGHFRNPGSDQPRSADLHTHALKEISRRLHLHHRWGI
jgi:hypothetical protein